MGRAPPGVPPRFRFGAQFFPTDVVSGPNRPDSRTAPHGHLIYRWYAY